MYRPCLSLLLFCVVGCGSLNLFDSPKRETVPTPLPSPTPLSADAAACLRNYGEGIAKAFDNAADAFDRHESSFEIITRMGDELEPARVDSFMPPMQALTAAAPKPGATDEEREAADLERSKMLRRWAAQIRGTK